MKQREMNQEYKVFTPMDRKEAAGKNPLVLAYIGDTIFDLYVRSAIVKQKRGTVHALNQMACKMVNAKAQAASAQKIMDELTEEELLIFKRGRNAKSSTIPKNMTVGDYKKATGLEALVGYLFLCGEYKRLDEIMENIIDQNFEGEQTRA